VSTYSGKYKTLAYKGVSRGAYGFQCPEYRNIAMQKSMFALPPATSAYQQELAEGL